MSKFCEKLCLVRPKWLAEMTDTFSKHFVFEHSCCALGGQMSGSLVAKVKFFVIRFQLDWNYIIRRGEIINLEKSFMLLRTIRTSTLFP